MYTNFILGMLVYYEFSKYFDIDETLIINLLLTGKMKKSPCKIIIYYGEHLLTNKLTLYS